MKARTVLSRIDNPWASTFQVSAIRTTSPNPRPATAGTLTPPSGSDTDDRSGVALRRIDVVGLELPVEVAALDAEPIGGARHVPVVGAELGQDIGALEVVARVLERAVARLARARRRLLGSQRCRQIVGGDHVTGGHDDEPLHHVA